MHKPTRSVAAVTAITFALIVAANPFRCNKKPEPDRFKVTTPTAICIKQRLRK